jgi:hypothetical protein
MQKLHFPLAHAVPYFLKSALEISTLILKRKPGETTPSAAATTTM